MYIGPRIAKITTSSFLIDMNRKGAVPSTEAFHRELSSAGRNIHRDRFELQAASTGAAASWTDTYEMS